MIAGQTTNTITVNSVLATNAGLYTIEVTGICTSVTNTATLVVNTNVSASALADVVVCEGQSSAFATVADGTGPLTFVWKKNGNVIAGQTQDSLNFSPAQLSDAGTYTVEVAGLCTSVTNRATLAVNTLTTTSDLTSLVRCPGQTAVCTTVASGTGTFSYLWSKDGQVIATETGAQITLTNVTASDAAVYSVRVTGTCNSIDKSATLTVNTNTAATSLISLVLCPGQDATFTTVASGTGPLSYVWKKDGILQGSTSNSLSVASVASSDAGLYTVEVTGTCTSVTNSATLTVNTNTAATSLTDLMLCPGQTATFSTVASGTGLFGYVWKKDGVVIVGETTNSLSVTSVTAANAGSYTVEVTVICTSVTNSATLTVNENISSSASTEAVVCQGRSATFSTEPTGTGPYSYVWKQNGNVLSGATTNTITIASADLVNAGTYTVEVTGLCTAVTNSATLTVNVLTSSTDLTSLVLCPGKDATFGTVASGTGPFTYIWTKEGQPIWRRLMITSPLTMSAPQTPAPTASTSPALATASTRARR